MKIAHKIMVAVASISFIMLLAGNILFVNDFMAHITKDENRQIERRMVSVDYYFNEMTQNNQLAIGSLNRLNSIYGITSLSDSDILLRQLDKNFFTDLKIDFVFFFDKNGRLAGAKYYDSDSGSLTQPPQDLAASVLAHAGTFADSGSRTMIFQDHDKFYITTATAMADLHIGQLQDGKLVIGRISSEAMLANIRGLTDSSIALYAIEDIDSGIAGQLSQGNQNYFKVANSDSITVYTLLSRYVSSPSPVVLQMTVSRDFYITNMKKMYLLMLIYTLVVLLATALSLFLINRLVIRPVVDLSEKISHVDTSSALPDRFGSDGRDELSLLGNAINAMLGEIEKERDNRSIIQKRLIEAQSIANIGHWELDLPSMRLWVSAQAFKIYGLAQESSYFPVEDALALIDKSDRKKIKKAFILLLDEKDGFNAEYKTASLDGGQPRIIHAIARLDYDRDGRAVKMIGTIQDITERVRTEAELLESERSKSVLLSNLPGIAYRCDYDRNWTMRFMSEGCYELTGYKPESLLNNNEITFNELIYPEYRDLLWDMWAQAVEKKEAFRGEYPIRTASGELKWVFEQGRAIYGNNGCVQALEGLIIDITDRKNIEDEIRYLSHHDALTGLCNRRWFEAQKERTDHADQMPLSVIIGDINGLKLINDALGHAAGDRLIVETARIMSRHCRNTDVIARTGGDEFCILMPRTDSKDAYDILKQIQKACEEYNRSAEGEAYYINISLGYATKNSLDDDIDLILKTAEDYMYKRKLLEHKSSRSAIISSIKTTMFERSQETEQHAERLTSLSKAVGLKLCLSQAEMDELELLATLHDIGKVGIDDKILNKPGKLTEAEWVEMKKHPEVGYRIALSSPELSPVAEYILSHHECWDGSGYPQGLKGEQIPLMSRILAVVDAFDAMTQDRPYRKKMAHDLAIKEIAKNSGKQFDPHIVRIFIDEVMACIS